MKELRRLLGYAKPYWASLLGSVVLMAIAGACHASIAFLVGPIFDRVLNPSPKTGQLDNRGSQYYLAMYWAQELAAQTDDKALQSHFAALAKTLADNEKKIMEELNAVQGKPVDIGGYYLADLKKVTAVMRPSATLNAAVDALYV